MPKDSPSESSPPIACLLRPDVRLIGEVDQPMAQAFRDQVDAGDTANVTAVELTTFGGDADFGRLIADEVRLRLQAGRQLIFLGRTVVFSAGVNIMAAFPRDARYLSRDTSLLIHERRQTKDVHLEGPLRVCAEVLHGLIAEVENGMALQRQGFEQLIDGSSVSMDDLERRIRGNWYLSAEEALELGLVAGLF
jgi:hypothetical protein